MVQGPVSKSNSVGNYRQPNSGSLHKQTGRNPLSGDVCSPLQNQDLVPSLQNKPTSQAHSGYLNVMTDSLSRSNQVQSTEWSLHLWVFKQICQKYSTPHVDLFTTCMNHKMPLYLSSVPDQHAWDIDALNIDWSGLSALLHRVIQNQAVQLPHNSNSCRLARDVLVLGPSAALNLDPTPFTSVNNTSQLSHNQVSHNNPQHLNLHAWCLGVDSSKNKASLWKWQRALLPLKGHQQGPSTSQSGSYLKKWCREISVNFSTPSGNKYQTFSCICTKT